MESPATSAEEQRGPPRRARRVAEALAAATPAPAPAPVPAPAPASREPVPFCDLDLAFKQEGLVLLPPGPSQEEREPIYCCYCKKRVLGRRPVVYGEGGPTEAARVLYEQSLCAHCGCTFGFHRAESENITDVDAELDIEYSHRFLGGVVNQFLHRVGFYVAIPPRPMTAGEIIEIADHDAGLLRRGVTGPIMIVHCMDCSRSRRAEAWRHADPPGPAACLDCASTTLVKLRALTMLKLEMWRVLANWKCARAAGTSS